MEMQNIVYCKDCKYVTYWRKGREDEILDCSLNVFLNPKHNDFCSRGEKVLRCSNCGMRFDSLPNYCPKCGEKLS